MAVLEGLGAGSSHVLGAEDSSHFNRDKGFAMAVGVGKFAMSEKGSLVKRIECL